MNKILDKRRAGVLLHPSSLPSGGFGADASRFLDFIHDAGLRVWQMLPLGPTHKDRSPYHCLSVHAINPELLCLDWLIEKGWLTPADGRSRHDAIQQAAKAFFAQANSSDRAAFDEMCHARAHWLDDYALYRALRDEHHGRPWWDWPPPLRDRDVAALHEARARLSARVDTVRFEQFVADAQWRQLRDAARERGVMLLGDMPIFVAHDSADVWAHRSCFKLDEAGQPRVIAGVPPDYFSATGQCWGNPLYDWDAMQAQGFEWWIRRLETEFSRFDVVRIDHFRGFEASWEIPAGEKTAVNGKWVKVPGDVLFDALLAHFGHLPLVAEDLGLITPEVHRLREKYALPGMAVLQFAFDGGADNPYLPHNIKTDTVAYTGTHDNDTTVSWFEELDAEKQSYVIDYLGHPHEPMPWPLIRTALRSVACLAILPMQDLQSLGRGHRMNTPGTANDRNWTWKFAWSDMPPDLASRLHRLVNLYGRG